MKTPNVALTLPTVRIWTDLTIVIAPKLHLVSVLVRQTVCYKQFLIDGLTNNARGNF